jgi:hypothetical protein
LGYWAVLLLKRPFEVLYTGFVVLVRALLRDRDMQGQQQNFARNHIRTQATNFPA